MIVATALPEEEAWLVRERTFANGVVIIVKMQCSRAHVRERLDKLCIYRPSDATLN